MTAKDLRVIELSRRTVLHGAALVTGAAAFAAASIGAGSAAAATMKVSQQAAAYQPTAKGQQRCNNCKQWQPPSSCKVVKGPVVASGWCNLYAAKS